MDVVLFGVVAFWKFESKVLELVQYVKNIEVAVKGFRMCVRIRGDLFLP